MCVCLLVCMPALPGERHSLTAFRQLFMPLGLLSFCHALRYVQPSVVNVASHAIITAAPSQLMCIVSYSTAYSLVWPYPVIWPTNRHAFCSKCRNNVSATIVVSVISVLYEFIAVNLLQPEDFIIP